MMGHYAALFAYRTALVWKTLKDNEVCSLTLAKFEGRLETED